MSLLRQLGSVIVATALLALAACTAPTETARLPNAPPAAAGSPAQRWLAMGDAALAAGDAATAAGFYQQAAGVAADDKTALERLGQAFARAGRWQDSADVYTRLIDLGASDAATGRGYARAMLALGQPAAAQAHLEAALAADPDDVAALNMLGVARDMLGDGAAAQEAYRRGLTLAPDHAGLRNNLGLSLALAGDHAGAMATLEPLANGPGSTARARQNLALAHALGGDVAAAERIGLIDLDPASVRANLRYIGILRGTGDKAGLAGSMLTELATDAPPEPPRRPAIAAAAPAADATAVAAGPVTVGRVGTGTPAGGGPIPLGPEPPADGRSPATQALPVPALPLPVAAPMPVADLPITPSEVALGPADMAAGLPPIGSWLVDLGDYGDAAAAHAAWRRLRAAHGELLHGLTRMAGAGSGRQPLLLGPLPSEADARRICTGLTARSVDCTTLKI